MTSVDKDFDDVVPSTVWADSISLPIHGKNLSSKRHNKFALLSRNYAFIKHMMFQLGLNLNQDYLILGIADNDNKINVKLHKNCAEVASMAVLIWPKYKDAKLESTV